MVYVHGIYTCIYTCIYACDIQLIIKLPINSPTYNFELVECISEIMNWLLMNDLLVNTLKTELINVSRIPIIFPYVLIDGKLIQLSDSVRNLDVIMDSYLSFGYHMNAV